MGDNMPVNPRVPLELHLSIASVNAAIEYWLSHVVLQDTVRVTDVRFSEKEHFTILFDRTSVVPEKEGAE